MSYDLRRLPLHGIIERVAGTNTYQVTNDGVLLTSTPSSETAFSARPSTPKPLT